MSKFLSRGNKEFSNENFSKAIEYYDLSSKKGNKPRILSDSLLNQSISASFLDLPKLARNYFAEALEVPVRNEAIQTSQKEMNEVPIRQISQSFSDDDLGFFEEIEESSFFKNINSVNDSFDIDRWSPTIFSKRCFIYSQIGDYKNAHQEAQIMTTVDPMSPIFWEIRAECAWLIKDIKSLEESVKNCKKLGASPNLHMAKYYWLKKEYDLADKYLNAAVENHESAAVVNRSKFNLLRGRVMSVVKDTPNSPISIFTQKILPTKVNLQILSQCPFLNYVLYSFYRSFSVPLSSLKPSMFIEIPVQKAWVHGTPTLSQPSLNSSVEDIPQCFCLKIKDMETVKHIHESGRLFGRLIDKDSINERATICYGLATLEVSKCISSYLNSTDKPSNIPGFSNVITIIMNWLRLIDPTIPVFIRNQIVNTPLYIHVQKKGISTELYSYNQRLFEKLKNGISHSTSKEIYVHISSAQTIDELWSIFKSDIKYPIPNSPASIFLSSHNNTLDFGLVVEEGNESRIHANDEVITLWYNLMNTARAGKVGQNVFEFIRTWMRASPLTNYSHVAGSILLFALLHSIFGVTPEENVMKPFDLQIEALLSQNLEKFIEYLKGNDMKLHVDSSVDQNLPDIAKLMPNLHMRIQMLLDIPEHSQTNNENETNEEKENS
ncbi:TPR Domain containing protein [Histomonas meleagridis]|uniref:TPR Domain containing protein n=1 Tax=Histomonas meleagridis TaxID=135588 RepID=UPI003559B95C|nr:TPR Domain containing protein [Histomonas meleagridis]KAH0801081.1 TPR Domain containing protein [Histomonas meleagridis]